MGAVLLFRAPQDVFQGWRAYSPGGASCFACFRTDVAGLPECSTKTDHSAVNTTTACNFQPVYLHCCGAQGGYRVRGLFLALSSSIFHR